MGKKKKQGSSAISKSHAWHQSPQNPNSDFISCLLDNLEPEIPRTPLQRAQRLIYDALEADRPEMMAAVALKALEISPDCADAYNILAEEYAETVDETMEYYRKGMAAGERAIGAKTFKEYTGSFWGILETRPYMRALQGYAQCLWECGRPAEAMEHYRQMLRLNPNDNQGIRYLLAGYLLETGQDIEAAALLKRYKNDGSATWAYGKTLLSFRQHGNTAATLRLLREAINVNPHVPDLLLGSKKMPKWAPEVITRGQENEAVYYVGELADGWRKTPGALEWLATAQPNIMSISDLRRKKPPRKK